LKKIFLGRFEAHCAARVLDFQRSTPRFPPKAKIFQEREIDDGRRMLMLWSLVV